MSNQFLQPIILYFTPDEICIESFIWTSTHSSFLFFFFFFWQLVLALAPRRVSPGTPGGREGETIVFLLGNVKVSKSEKRIEAFMQFSQTHVLPGKLALWQVTDTQSRTVIHNNRKIKLKQGRKKGRYGISKHQKIKNKNKILAYFLCLVTIKKVNYCK